MAFELQGGVSGAKVDVDDSTKALKTLAQPNSQGAITNLYGQTFEVGNNGRVRVSPDSVVLNDLFSGSALNTNKWASAMSISMANTVGSGYLTLNSAGISASGAYCNINSILQPSYSCDYSNYAHFRILVPAFASNSVIELGWGNCPASAAAPTDGFFFRINGSGVMSVVMSFNGTETTQTASGAMTAGTAYEVELEIFEGRVKWYVADAAGNNYFSDASTVSTTADLFTPATQLKAVQLAADNHMPVFCRMYNLGPTVSPCQPRIGVVNFAQRDLFRTKSWNDVVAAQGSGAYQGPAPASLVQTSNHANSTSPTSAALSNTAAGYTTLGGRYQFAVLAGAVTDYALFAFQVPSGFQLYINSITISAMNTGAANSASVTTQLDWAVAVNSSTVSLATAESPPTSWAPRRIPLGMQAFVVSAAIGVAAPDIVRNFPTPLVCDGGRFVHIALQVPVGAATASQIIRGDVMINGYFE